ncbi:MAG: hypothetical protein J7M24_04430 [Candidatus Latescibacteria bacterium]|nr:hypothetical protein [Candidatus Latescibacterota bacterium]
MGARRRRFQGGKARIRGAPGTPYNYITIEGNLRGPAAILADCVKEDLARWITSADNEGLACRMFSFDPLPRTVTARLFRIDPGVYRVTLAEDRDGKAGSILNSREMRMRRFDTVTLTVPPKKPVLLTVKLIERQPDPGPRPDLAIAGYDCTRDGAAVTVRVSNLGAAPSKETVLRITGAAGRTLAETPVPPIGAPTDFVERSVSVEFTDLPLTGTLTVTVDQRNRQVEIFEGNNRAALGANR